MDKINAETLEYLLTDGNLTASVNRFLTLEGKLVFKDLLIEGEAIFQKPIYLSRDTTFEGCIFENAVLIQTKFSSEGKIHFIHCEFKNDFNVLSGICKKLLIENSTLNGTLNFKGGTFDNVKIENGSFYSINIYRLNCLELLIGGYDYNTLVNRFFFNFSRFESKVLFYRCIINELDLRGAINASTEVSVSDSFIRHVNIIELTNHGKFKLDKIMYALGIFQGHFNLEYNDRALKKNIDVERLHQYYRGGLFSIENSVLNDSELNLIDFSTYNSVSIKDSNLANIIFTNVNWPKSILNRPSPKNEFFQHSFEVKTKNNLKLKSSIFTGSDYSFRSIRESYRQLKNAASKQNDHISEQYFHGLEMSSYNHTLSWKKDFWTKWILFLSQVTSNFGQSFIRPILSLIVVNGILFYVLYVSDNSRFNSYDFSVLTNYFNTIADFLRISNPLHKNEPELTGVAFILDTLIRIISSYLIYNIIRATRRFVR